MTRPPSDAHDPRVTLSNALMRAHVVCALIAVSLAGGTLMVAGMTQLRDVVENNLQLVARSIAYTADAAVVFHDKAAALESVTRIASADGVDSATVFDTHGNVLADWQRHRERAFDPVREFAGRLLLRAPVVVPILNDGFTVGQVRLIGSPDGLVGFVLAGFLWIVACLLLSVVSTLYLSRRIFNSITTPLGELAQVTHRVRTARAFGQRVPPAHIVELDELASDFNSLLDELEKWEAGMQRENKSLAHQATHDALTGLPNRVFFDARLAQVAEQAASEQHRFAVLFMDCDRFKEINDTRGHGAGDRVLAITAARIKNQLRLHDMVARIGGDEFGAVLSALRDVGDAHRIARNIAKAMREPIALDDGSTVALSVSVGIAMYPDDATDADGLVRVADTAMYEIKTQLSEASRSQID